MKEVKKDNYKFLNDSDDIPIRKELSDSDSYDKYKKKKDQRKSSGKRRKDSYSDDSFDDKIRSKSRDKNDRSRDRNNRSRDRSGGRKESFGGYREDKYDKYDKYNDRKDDKKRSKSRRDHSSSSNGSDSNDYDSVRHELKKIAKISHDYEEKQKKAVWRMAKIERHDGRQATELAGFIKFLTGTLFGLDKTDASKVAKKFELKCGKKHKHDRDLQTNQRKRYVDLDKMYDALEEVSDRRSSVAARGKG
jgi:hypothetical protein